MSVHPRVLVVQEARRELGAFLGQLIAKHGLSYAEVFMLLGHEITSWANHAVRDERRPPERES